MPLYSEVGFVRVVTAAEMAEMDRTTIEDYGIPGVVLMENAGRHVVEAMLDMLGQVRGKTVVVIAGKGNNGGDGFVVARHLKNMGAEVFVHLLADQSQISGDARVNLDIWLNMGGVINNPLHNGVELLTNHLTRCHIIIDALYGTGFKGSLRENVVPVVKAVNSCPAPVVAVDIPSGLEADTGRVQCLCVRASRTVTFGCPKIGLVTGSGPEYCGYLQVVDISIPGEVMRGGVTELTTPERVKQILPRRSASAHKGDFGHVLVVGGSPGMSGAVCLSARACGRAGAGLVTAAVPRGLHSILEIKLTEVMTTPLPENGEGFLSRQAAGIIDGLLEKMDVLALGPGLGTSEETVETVEAILMRTNVPYVLDADGINAVAKCGFNLRKITSGGVITPHPGEMARLMGCSTAEVQADRLGIARRAAEESGAVVVLKGAGSIVAVPGGKSYINPTGNSGMASGGSGDVLTGVIAGFLAQGLSPENAAVAGVYMHGFAGDRVAIGKGTAGILAGDIIEVLPECIKECKGEQR